MIYVQYKYIQRSVRHFGSSHALDFQPAGVARDMEEPEPWEVFDEWERPATDGPDVEWDLDKMTREECEDELLAYIMHLKTNSHPVNATVGCLLCYWICRAGVGTNGPHT